MEPALELRPGRFSDRFVAYLLDTVPFAVAAVLSVWVWGGPLTRSGDQKVLVGLGAAWTGLAVFWQFVGNLSGGTPGKRLMGLRVVTSEGKYPGFLRALVRALGWLLSTPLANLGFLVALVHPRTRALHDLLSGTFIVETGPRRSSGAAVFLVASLAAAGLFVLNYGAALLRPTPKDMAAISKAYKGLEVVALIQEVYKGKHGMYAGTVADLAEASGDAEVFRRAMLEVFSPTPFILEAGNRGWHVTAAAKDRRRTRVRRYGP
ncbi:MAG: hypothetical protein A2X40_09050 [Elusimicrobia bacterium GWC2_65_9]|nr:MAG: hypothetical protein A2X37_01625 [Elusimicrobia bacterium GWA2_66_18]OGR74083.1 MAG: hypothetical protein A2X40_09050 [Elusimicrobia bacterium GWC2_65_9]